LEAAALAIARSALDFSTSARDTSSSISPIGPRLASRWLIAAVFYAWVATALARATWARWITQSNTISKSPFPKCARRFLKLAPTLYCMTG
jgi:hypothetical protein